MTSKQPRHTDAPAAKAAAAAANKENNALVHARREKLKRWRDTYGITGYGEHVDGLSSLSLARSMFDNDAHEQFAASSAAAKDAPPDAKPDAKPEIIDNRPRAMGSPGPG